MDVLGWVGSSGGEGGGGVLLRNVKKRLVSIHFIKNSLRTRTSVVAR